MADNVVLNAGSGGSTARTKDRTGVETQIVALDLNPAGTETLMAGGMPHVPSTTGGLLQKHVVAAATTNATSVKGSAGQLYGVDVYNNAAYPVYVKFYNKATAPTVGTDTVLRTFGVQAGVGRTRCFPDGIAFSLGIGLAITKGITDADTTAVALSDCVVDVDYF